MTAACSRHGGRRVLKRSNGALKITPTVYLVPQEIVECSIVMAGMELHALKQAVLDINACVVRAEAAIADAQQQKNRRSSIAGR